METFGKFCYTVILLVITTFIGTYVFLNLWEWFIMTTFHAQSLNFAQGMGIMLFVGFLKPKSKPEKDEKFDIEKFTKQSFEALLMAGFILGLGYIISRFL